MSMEQQTDLRLGPNPNVTYPLQVHYCGNCSLPIEVNYKYFFLIYKTFERCLSIIINRKYYLDYEFTIIKKD